MSVFRYRIAEIGSSDFTTWLRLRTDLYLESGLITPDELDSTGFYVDRYETTRCTSWHRTTTASTSRAPA